jgi:hypothetical protein
MNMAELQSRKASALMSPLTGSDSMPPRTVGGKKMCTEVNELIKPNERLTSLERLEIYSRSYWFHILDGVYEDFPGLAAVLGQRAFHRLARAYLTECPSQSFTMRNLGSRLAVWLEAHPRFGRPVLDLAVDMARLEWAHIEAFDGPERKPLGPEDLLERGPDVKLALQPHLTLLALHYPVDDFRIEAAGFPPDGHGATSNAVGHHKLRNFARFRRNKPEPVYLAVHRRQASVYYRRMDRGEFLVLEGLRAGKPIAEALESALSDVSNFIAREESAATVERWFAGWSELGWFYVADEACGA